jgi:putative ABC transport system permease protein
MNQRLPQPAVRSLAGLAVRLARQWARPVASLSAACGIVAATIVGAVGVGESMQKGLARLALSRLGGIEAAVVSESLFRQQLAAEVSAAAGPGLNLVPAVLLEVVVDRPAGTAGPRLSSRATLLACDDPAALGFPPLAKSLTDNSIAINPPLARALDAAAGEPLVLRVPERSAAPADSPLGRRALPSRGRRFSDTVVLGEEGLGLFSLRPEQVTGPLAVVSLTVAEEILEAGSVANVLFAVADDGAPVGAPSIAERLRDHLQPELADYGLKWEAIEAGGTLRLTSERLILPEEADRAAEAVLEPLGGRPSLIFLATSIDAGGAAGEPSGSVPYSTVAGVTGTHLPAGDLIGADISPLDLAAGTILINRWMADDLAAQGAPVVVGDTITISSFEPETLHGQVADRQDRFRVAGIVEMDGAAVARDLVPEVQGVTDEDSIADWDPPFPFDASRVRSSPPEDQDDRYWKQYAATPKAFVPLGDARRIAAGRFGKTTAWHLPADGIDAETVAGQLAAAIRPEALGMNLLPLREEAIAAARGSTPFGGLFLALSSFVVAAGLLLLWLLLGLLVTTRQTEVGLLAAVGFPPRRLTALLLLVGGLAAVCGIAVGGAIGPLWSVALLRGLAVAWNESVAAGSLAAFGSSLPGPASVVAGMAVSLVISALAIRQAAAKAASLPPLPLLRGLWQAEGSCGRKNAGRLQQLLATGAVCSAAAVALVSRQASAAAAIGGFFAAGGLTLAGVLMLVRRQLAAEHNRKHPHRSLLAVAIGGLQHQAGRSFIVVAMVGVSGFLLVAVSSFSLTVPSELDQPDSPTGGWQMLLSFSRPTGIDPLDPRGQEAAGLLDDEVQLLGRCQVARIRASSGDAADCTNLYAAVQPTVLGLPAAFLQRGGFRFTSHADLPAGETNPWSLLMRSDREAPIPAVLDESTAMWALKLGGVGDRFTLPGDSGAVHEFEIVGLLAPGILQGWVLTSEDAFTRAFPSQSGYRLAMMASEASADTEAALAVLQAFWADDGVSVERASDRLASLYAVQNTFLAGFQALGGLGLLLGTAGIAAVAMQGVFERRQAFSVLRSIGFSRARLRSLVVLEQLVLVATGVAVGGICGLIALWPALESGRAAAPIGGMLSMAGLMLVTAVVAGVVAVARANITERPR